MNDPHRTIHVTTSGPTPKRELRAARVREGWRAFWRYRGEELSAVWAWCDDHFGLCVIALLIASVVGTLLGLQSFGPDESCAEDCAAIGYEESVSRGGCYCVTEDGAKLWPAN